MPGRNHTQLSCTAHCLLATRVPILAAMPMHRTQRTDPGGGHSSKSPPDTPNELARSWPYAHYVSTARPVILGPLCVIRPGGQVSHGRDARCGRSPCDFTAHFACHRCKQLGPELATHPHQGASGATRAQLLSPGVPSSACTGASPGVVQRLTPQGAAGTSRHNRRPLRQQAGSSLVLPTPSRCGSATNKHTWGDIDKSSCSWNQLHARCQCGG